MISIRILKSDSKQSTEFKEKYKGIIQQLLEFNMLNMNNSISSTELDKETIETMRDSQRFLFGVAGLIRMTQNGSPYILSEPGSDEFEDYRKFIFPGDKYESTRSVRDQQRGKIYYLENSIYDKANTFLTEWDQLNSEETPVAIAVPVGQGPPLKRSKKFSEEDDMELPGQGLPGQGFLDLSIEEISSSLPAPPPEEFEPVGGVEGEFRGHWDIRKQHSYRMIDPLMSRAS